MIRITVNGRLVELDESMTVEHMLDRVDVPPNYLAVEVNAEVVTVSIGTKGYIPHVR